MARGIFDSSAWKAQKTPLALLPDCERCGLYRACSSPRMPYSGQGQRKVLIIAEAPGETEDYRGEPLVGDAGMKLWKMLYDIGVDMRKDCWLTNAAICRPTDEKGHNRKPTKDEIKFCRPNLSKTLKEVQPQVIIPMGEAAVKSLMPLAWKDGEVDNITEWVKWQIPCVKLNAWICPTYHPSFLLRTEGKNAAAELHVRRHLKAAFSLQGRPWTKLPDWNERVFVLPDVKEADRQLKLLMEQAPALAFDYETTTLKPDGPHAEIICCSVSDGTSAIAFPWHGKVVDTMKKFLKSDMPKIGANDKFEARWSMAKLGVWPRNLLWDTMLGAHWLDCRRGITSVKFQSFVLLGAEDYSSHLQPYMESKRGSNFPNRLREVEPSVLLKYCGFDSLYEHLIYQKQARVEEATHGLRLQRNHQEATWRHQPVADGDFSF